MGHQSGAGGNVSKLKQRTNSIMPIAEAIGRGHRSLGHCGRKGRDVSWVGHWTEQSRFWIVDTLSHLGCKALEARSDGKSEVPRLMRLSGRLGYSNYSRKIHSACCGRFERDCSLPICCNPECFVSRREECGHGAKADTEPVTQPIPASFVPGWPPK